LAVLKIQFAVISAGKAFVDGRLHRVAVHTRLLKKGIASHIHVVNSRSLEPIR